MAPGATPDAAPLDAEHLAAQARRGHELLSGLVGGAAAVVVASAAVHGFSENIWGQLLALDAGLAILLRARLFRYTSQVACALIAGIAAIALLVIGLALNPPIEACDEWSSTKTVALWTCERSGSQSLRPRGLLCSRQSV